MIQNIVLHVVISKDYHDWQKQSKRNVHTTDLDMHEDDIVLSNKMLQDHQSSKQRQGTQENGTNIQLPIALNKTILPVFFPYSKLAIANDNSS